MKVKEQDNNPIYLVNIHFKNKETINILAPLHDLGKSMDSKRTFLYGFLSYGVDVHSHLINFNNVNYAKIIKEVS